MGEGHPYIVVSSADAQVGGRVGLKVYDGGEVAPVPAVYSLGGGAAGAAVSAPGLVPVALVLVAEIGGGVSVFVRGCLGIGPVLCCRATQLEFVSVGRLAAGVGHPNVVIAGADAQVGGRVRLKIYDGGEVAPIPAVYSLGGGAACSAVSAPGLVPVTLVPVVEKDRRIGVFVGRYPGVGPAPSGRAMQFELVLVGRLAAGIGHRYVVISGADAQIGGRVGLKVYDGGEVAPIPTSGSTGSGAVSAHGLVPISFGHTAEKGRRKGILVGVDLRIGSVLGGRSM